MLMMRFIPNTKINMVAHVSSPRSRGSRLYLVLLCTIGCGPMHELSEFSAPAFMIKPEPFLLSFKHDETVMAGTFTLNLSCDNVYSASSPGDWTQNNVSATSTVSIVAGKSCTITLVSYNDGTNTYSAVGTQLSIAVSNTGTITQSTARQYTTGGGSPTLKWFSANQGGSTYSAVVNYVSDPVSNTSSVTQTNLSAITFTLSMNGVAAPTVSGITLTITTSSGTYSYTLTATVSGSTGCKYIDNSSSTYTASSWSSVNTAYAAAGATACPTLTPGSATSGNWNSRWQSGKKTLVIWVNTLNGVNAFTTANFGPAN